MNRFFEGEEKVIKKVLYMYRKKKIRTLGEPRFASDGIHLMVGPGMEIPGHHRLPDRQVNVDLKIISMVSINQDGQKGS